MTLVPVHPRLMISFMDTERDYSTSSDKHVSLTVAVNLQCLVDQRKNLCYLEPHPRQADATKRGDCPIGLRMGKKASLVITLRSLPSTHKGSTVDKNTSPDEMREPLFLLG
ncbi:hypothetical protein OPQ81_011696 [Rhizoctonia solani]|nr:hypothetical protein OPQ81_011696 [Rhizoctonia solani]